MSDQSGRPALDDVAELRPTQRIPIIIGDGGGIPEPDPPPGDYLRGAIGEAVAGDVVVFDGDQWVRLAAPAADGIARGLTSDGGLPEWQRVMSGEGGGSQMVTTADMPTNIPGFTIPAGTPFFVTDAQGRVFMGDIPEDITDPDLRTWYPVTFALDPKTGFAVIRSLRVTVPGDPPEVTQTRAPGEEGFRSGAFTVAQVATAITGPATEFFTAAGFSFPEEGGELLVDGQAVVYTEREEVATRISGALLANASQITVAKALGTFPSSGRAKIGRQVVQYTNITRPLNTTLAVNAEAGDPTLTLTDATDLKAGPGVFHLASGGDPEKHRIKYVSKAGNVVTLDPTASGLDYDVLAGAAATQDRFEGVTGLGLPVVDFGDIRVSKFTGVTGLDDNAAEGSEVTWNPMNRQPLAEGLNGGFFGVTGFNGVGQGLIGSIYWRTAQTTLESTTMGGDLVFVTVTLGDDDYKSMRLERMVLLHNQRFARRGGGKNGGIIDNDDVLFPVHFGGYSARTDRGQKLEVGTTEVFVDTTDGWPDSGIAMGFGPVDTPVFTYASKELGKLAGLTVTTPGYLPPGSRVQLHPDHKEVVLGVEQRLRAGRGEDWEVTLGGKEGPNGEAGVTLGPDGGDQTVLFRRTDGKVGVNNDPDGTPVETALRGSEEWRQILRTTVRVSGGNAAGQYIVNTNGSISLPTVTGPLWMMLDLSELGVTGLDTELRIVAAIATNDTAPGQDIVLSLRPVGVPSGAANVLNPNVGAAVAGATATWTAPAANRDPDTPANKRTLEFDHPGDGHYVFAVDLAGAVAAASQVGISLRLEVRNRA